MKLRGPRVRALACLLLWSNVVAAGLIDPLYLRRDTPATTTATTADAAAASTTGADAASSAAAQTTDTDADTDATTTAAETSTAPTTTATAKTTTHKTTSTAQTHATSSTTASATSAVPTLTSNGTSLNETLFNTTIASGTLPLTPELTPGWGVAGIIMILTGAVYTLIGIKKRFLHTFFSTAFLASLGTTVLIIYVMTPPVKNAVQGGFVAAAVCTGLILGGVAIIFKDITEGLGCLLGGFSFGMWLLCLHEGGLMQDATGKTIFIVAFTVGGFAFYFTHWTRQYALIVCLAFSGATVTVLGIDAFSRAGLKEFWAYIWDLNDNLFPLGADTYPLTRGIRVELAVTVILFLAGIVSQLKLWRVVQERRAKREAEAALADAKRQEEEEALGRQLEAANARERQQWEAVYGDGRKQARRASENDSTPDSGVGDMDSEKKVMDAHTRAVALAEKNGEVVDGADDGEQIELAEMPANEDAMAAIQAKGAAEMVMESNEQDGKVTVRVAQDEFPNGPPDDDDAAPQHSPDRLAKEAAAAAGVSATATPDIVPLPFRVPVRRGGGEGTEKADGDDDDDDDDGDRSSVATFADEDDGVREHRRSLAKRLSQGSADVFRSLSQRSKRPSGAHLENRNGPLGESSEGLVTAQSIRFVRHDDNESVAATVDGMSSDDDADDDDENNNNNKRSDKRVSRDIEVKAELGEPTGEPAAQGKSAQGTSTKAVASALLSPPHDKSAEARPVSGETVNTEILDMPPSPAACTDSTTMMAKTANSEFSATDRDRTASPAEQQQQQQQPEETGGGGGGSRQGKSDVSENSTPASLTRARLPRSLSRIAMSYRTNEWAKHLSNAETPEPETLALDDYLQQPDAPSAHPSMASAGDAPLHDEAPAPINVAELTQTAATGAPPPAAPRSVSSPVAYGHLPHQPNPAAAAALPSPPTLSRSNSRQSITVQDVAPAAAAASRNTFMSGFRSLSANHISRRASLLRNEPIAEESEAPERTPAAEGAGGSVERRQSSNYGDNASMKAGTEAANMATAAYNTAPIPGVVSYSSPQTLIGQREMLLRSKSQTGLYVGGGPMGTAAAAAPAMGSLTAMPSLSTMPSLSAMAPMAPMAPASESGSVYNGFQPGGANVDLDDLPMSARRQLMRQSSQMSMGEGPRASTAMSASVVVPPPLPATTAGSTHFDSHQPKRGLQHLPSTAARQAQLATFRNSVAHELRTGVPVVPAGSGGKPGGLRESMSQPYLAAAAAAAAVGAGASPRGSVAAPAPYSGGREQEVQQSINASRNYLLNQKEAEVQRREMERLEKERTERAFEERMRRGDLQDAHREAMRRMQASAK